MTTFHVLLGLVALSVALKVLADRIRLPFATLLVLGGMGVALVPGIPTIELEPQLVLALFLPPLLQVSAYRTDWPVFKSSLRPILLLAVGAVFFSAMLVAVAAHWLAPELPWWAAVALGAIVSPPDAVAATSVLRRFDLPKRITVVLEGESLINDASSLVLYRLAVMAATVGTVGVAEAGLQLLATALGGLLVGWLVSRLAMAVFARIDDTLLDIGVSLLAGLGAYTAAEAVHASGVLATVACGLMLGRKQRAAFSAQTRLELRAVWDFVEFLLSGLVFMLIGLQLRGILERIHDVSPARLALVAAGVALTLVASRFVWVFAGAWVPRALSARLRRDDPLPPWTHSVVTSWAGMRGVVSMAAALALPIDFPGRDLIVLLAFAAILFTLVVQGASLGWLIERLGLRSDDEHDARAEDTARTRAELASAALETVKAASESGGDAGAAKELLPDYEAEAQRIGDDLDTDSTDRAAQQRVRLLAIDGARGKLHERNDQIDADSHRALAHELDLEEQRLRRSLGDG